VDCQLLSYMFKSSSILTVATGRGMWSL